VTAADRRAAERPGERTAAPAAGAARPRTGVHPTVPPAVHQAALVARDRLLRAGVVRDTAAVRHIVAFLVATVATVLLTRALLVLTGFPQLGGGGLHVAHVLWGGLLMALAVVLLLSYVGPALRPLASVLGGVGFGLFVDEIGKFVTADNDYFFAPTPAMIYVVVAVLVIVVELMHGRRAHQPAEYLAVAADRLSAGVAGGLTDAGRAEIEDLLRRSGDEPGAAELRRVLGAVPHDDVAVPDPVRALVLRLDTALRAAVARPWARYVVSAAVVLVAAQAVAVGLGVLGGRIDVVRWVGVVVLAGVAGTVVCAVLAIAAGRTATVQGAVWMRRAVLVSLLISQPFVFRALEWAAVAGLVVDLVAFGLLEVVLRDGAQRAREQAEAAGSDGAPQTR
jgi:hypothetical protein